MLKYKALWIDDSIDSAEPKVEGIKDFLGDEAIIFEPILREDAVNIDEYLNDPELDIIITDFNGIDVKELIQKVHILPKYIDLVLYSENPPSNFYDVARSIPGIYPCIRSEVEDTIKKVIQSTIRRTQNVNNMRGIVISEGIDIENQVESIIIKYFDDKGDLARKVLEEESVCDFEKKVRFLNSILKNVIKGYNKRMSIEKEPDIKTEIQKKRSEIQPLYDIAKRLDEEVRKPRNMLAHVELNIGGDNIPYLKSLSKGYEDIKADSEWYKKTRKDLQKHAENLKNIFDFISNKLK